MSRPAEAGAADAGATAVEPDAGGFGSLGVTVGALVAVWAAILAAAPLKDNSFLTHLATGRLILDEGTVPSADPYTYTALGTEWTVQSWLASVAYAGAERAGGGTGLRLLVLAVFVAAALLLWRLSRPATSIVVRIAIVAAAMLVATVEWTERPYMIGVLGLGVVWLALDGAVRPWLLVPLLWVWANTHGSHPLAYVLILAVMAGTALDQRRRRIDGNAEGLDLRTEIAVLRWTAVGTVLAVVGPLGIDVLVFPFTAVSQSDTLSQIVEWQSPEFTSTSDRVFLALGVVAVAGLVRTGRWRLALPMLVFFAAAIVARRNMVMALTVLVPVLAACAPEIGTLTSRSRPSIGPGLAAVSAALLIVVGASTIGEDVTTLEPYPGHPLTWLAQPDPATGGRVATQDFTGNLLEALDGPVGQVFMDDRADMYPAEVYDDYGALDRGEPEWEEILDTYGVELLVWERGEPLASLLAADDDWRVAFSDLRWLVACRRQTACATIAR